MNLEVVWCVLILIALCFFGAVGSAVWLGAFTEHAPFLNELSFEALQPGWNGFLTFWTFIIIFQASLTSPGIIKLLLNSPNFPDHNPAVAVRDDRDDEAAAGERERAESIFS